MAGKSSVIVVRVLGNTKGLTRSLKKANDSLGGLERISRQITGSMKVAAIAAAAFGAAAVAGAAVGAAALAAIPAALLGIGIAFAAQNAKVKSAFSDLKSHVVGVMREITKPLVGPLVAGAGQLKAAFDALVPSLRSIFQAAAPLLDQVFAQMVPLARQLGPLLQQAFAAGTPVLMAFVKGLRPLMRGLRGFFAELGKGSGKFAEFASALMAGLGNLLPAVGRLLTALAPIGTTILSAVLPALTSLVDLIAQKVGPYFERFAGFMREHPTLMKAIGVAAIGLVVGIKALQVGMAAATVATQAFSAVAAVVRGAIIVWRNAQLALNLAMYANPVGLVIAAIVALVAVFVIAYKKSETFRNIVQGAWAGIKRATVAVWGFISGFIKKHWKLILAFVTGPIGILVALIVKNWSKIKGFTKAAWAYIKDKIVSPIRTALGVVRSVLGNIRSALANAWGVVKSKTREAWQAVVTVVREKIAAFMEVVRGIKGRVLGALGNAANWLVSVGRNIVRGLISGVGSMAGALIDKVKGVVGGAISGAKRLLGIASPSKVFREFGRMTTQGLAVGIKETAGLAARAATGLAGEVARGFTAPQLELAARPAFTGAAASGGATATNVSITVNVPPTADKAAIGRELGEALDAYYAAGGRRRA